MLQTLRNTQELKDQEPLKVGVIGGAEGRRFDMSVWRVVKSLPNTTWAQGLPCPSRSLKFYPPKKLIQAGFQPRVARHSWGGGEALDRNKVKRNFAALPPLQSYFPSRLPECITFPGQKPEERAEILNFGGIFQRNSSRSPAWSSSAKTLLASSFYLMSFQPTLDATFLI